MKASKALFIALMLGLFVLSESAADINGIWKGQLTDPEGNKRDFSFSFKAVGNKLTGTVTGLPMPGMVQAIENGNIEGDQISFDVNTKGPDGSVFTLTFTAKVRGDQMKGSVVTPAGQNIPFIAATGPNAAAAIAAEKNAPSKNTINLQQPLNPKGRNPIPEDAQEAILALFDKYEVVGGMNTHEGNKDVDDFILNLVRNPAFPDKVNDIAVECGNSLYQPILDRYIAGEDVPLSEVRQAWRNTTQPSCGFSALDEALPQLVRRINQKLPPGKKLRVLALDPPVDWSKVKSLADLGPFMDRDASIVSVMEKEVFAKHRKALITIGVRHLAHGSRGIFDQKYPNATFVISNHWGFGNDTPASAKSNVNDELEKRMASWPVPSLVKMKDTWLADLAPAYFSPDVGYPRVDGYLYLSPRDLLLNQPIPADIALDKDYMAELQRRANIRGRPMLTLQQLVESGVFFYDPAEHQKK